MIYGGLWDLLVVSLLLVKVVIQLNLMVMMSDPFVHHDKKGEILFWGGAWFILFVCLFIFHVFKFKTIWFCTYFFSLDYVFCFITIGFRLSMFHMLLIITLCSFIFLFFLCSIVNIFNCLYFYRHTHAHTHAFMCLFSVSEKTSILYIQDICSSSCSFLKVCWVC